MSDEQANAGQRMEEFVYDDRISRMFMLATMIWAFVAMLVGLLVALQLVLPLAIQNMAEDSFIRQTLSLLFEHEWLTFGRLRPLHTNAAIFAFAGNAFFTACYYSTQRLCKTRMFSDLLGRIHFWGWQAIIVSAALTLPLGITQSKEYAELEWPIDIAVVLIWVVFAINFLGTLVVRRERHIYVALWFYIASIVTVAILYIFNNLSMPVTATESYPVYAGVQDAFMQWWYGHNAVAFFLTTPFLGLMYYFLPKAAERPIYSYRLSIIHFWSLVFIYIWCGPHHLHYTALPEWASTLGMVFSLMLWMPSWGGMINGLLTLRGAWRKVAADPVLKFFVVGVTFYGMSTFEGPLLSIKSVNSLSHYTDWTIAHVHSGTLGWNGFMTFGMMYWLLPRLFQTKLWSKKLAATHFWIGTIGILFYVVPIYIAGLTQGLMWRAFTDNGQLAYPQFVETVTRLVPFYWWRVLGGSLYLTGVVLLGVNFFMTWLNRPSKYEEPIQRAPALRRGREKTAAPESRLGDTNIEAGHKLDRILQGAWHRTLEGVPMWFTVWVIVAVGVASLAEIVPMFAIKSNVKTIASVKPYTPLELIGRDIYVNEGCYNCHSQMIRALFAETERYGDYSKAGEFVYDHPFQWGSRRIGPDLAREGGKQSNYWHRLHMENPRDITDGSIMPSYRHMFRKDLDWDSIPARIRAMVRLGVPYDKQTVANCVEMAHEQARQVTAELVDQSRDPADEALVDKQIIALIAYLQRLGVDAMNPVEEEVIKQTAAPVPAGPAGGG